jgi:hypothetical protein
MIYSAECGGRPVSGSTPGVKPVIRVGECLQILDFLACCLNTSIDLANVSSSQRRWEGTTYRIPELEGMIKVLRKV